MIHGGVHCLSGLVLLINSTLLNISGDYWCYAAAKISPVNWVSPDWLADVDRTIKVKPSVDYNNLVLYPQTNEVIHPL